MTLCVSGNSVPGGACCNDRLEVYPTLTKRHNTYVVAKHTNSSRIPAEPKDPLVKSPLGTIITKCGIYPNRKPRLKKRSGERSSRACVLHSHVYFERTVDYRGMTCISSPSLLTSSWLSRVSSRAQRHDRDMCVYLGDLITKSPKIHGDHCETLTRSPSCDAYPIARNTTAKTNRR